MQTRPVLRSLSADFRVIINLAHPWITVNHQTFSDQLHHLISQTKFDQTNLLYLRALLMGKSKGKKMSIQFSNLLISTA